MTGEEYRGRLSSRVGTVILVVALLVFTAEQTSITAVNGWWVDELYSLWSTDPSLPFAQAYSDRFGLDPTPPLYYVALYWVRHWLNLPAGQERVGVLILSICSLFLASVAVVGASRRACLAGVALVTVAALLLSGPVLTFVPEARAYLMAMTIVFVASWFVAQTIEEPTRRPHGIWFGVIGVLAALTHFYAALMCGCLAAGLIVLAAFGGRREMLIPALTLGLSAAGAYAIWFLTSAGPTVWLHQGWLRFTLKIVLDAGREVRHLEIGGKIATAILAVLLASAMRAVALRPTRFLTLAFGTAFALFTILPILISFKTPVVVDRYWLIGGPALIVLMVFLARTALPDSFRAMLSADGDTLSSPSAPSRILPPIIGLGMVALLISSSVTGFIAARERTENKPVWKGAEIVLPLIKHCPPASVHVSGFIAGYAQITHASAQLFADADMPETPLLTALGSACPVLGWAEHVRNNDSGMVPETDAELLKLLKIDAAPQDIEIRRHKGGYVVLRRTR